MGLQGGAGVVHCGGDEDYAAAEGGGGGWNDLSMGICGRSAWGRELMRMGAKEVMRGGSRTYWEFWCSLLI